MTTITRRTLVAGALTVAATALPDAAHGAPAIRLSGPPQPADWAALARTLTGSLALPGSGGYASGKALFSPEFDTSTPAAVVRVRRQSDIQHCLAFATRYQLRVTMRSGGHSYVGASAASGCLVLDTRDYAHVGFDPNSSTATVFSGANLYAVQRTLAAHGVTIPSGTCPSVGLAGLTLGGGLGVSSRHYGLTCDRLVSATVVLPDGQATTTSLTHSPDLFWALRGGGGGANAVVTSLRLATHDAAGKGLFSLTFPAAQAVAVLTRTARWLEGTYRSRWAGVRVSALGQGQISVRITGVVNSAAQRAAADSLIEAIGVAPLRASYRQLSHLETVAYLGGGTVGVRESFVAGTDVIATMDTAAATAIVAAVAEQSRAGGRGVALIDPLDGAVRQTRPEDTAFPWRRHAASVQWYLGASTATSRASGRAWIARAHRRVAPYSSGGYVNYLETGDAARRYFAANTARLHAVRQTYDPRRRLWCGVAV